MDVEKWESQAELAAWFATNAPFSALPQEIRDRLLEVSVVFTFQPGELILQQRDDQNPFVWGVLDGEIRLYEDVAWIMEVARLPGHVFGISAVMKEGPQPYNALASLPSACVRIPASLFVTLCEDDEAFGEYFSSRFVDAPNQHPIGGWVGGDAGSPYTMIQNFQGDGNWGRVLDAGTGDASLAWIISQQTERWSAVTISEELAAKLRTVMAFGMREDDEVLAADWRDPELLSGEVFDVVIVDHLIGAIERYSPLFQYDLFRRLRPHVDKRLYVVGFHPVHKSNSPAAKIILESHKMLNVCLLLAGEEPYREYPASWVSQSLEHSGFSVLAVQHFGHIYGLRYVHSVLNDSLRLLAKVQDSQLCLAIAHSIRDLRERAMSTTEFEWGVLFNHDYLVVAEPT